MSQYYFTLETSLFNSILEIFLIIGAGTCYYIHNPAPVVKLPARLKATLMTVAKGHNGFVNRAIDETMAREKGGVDK